MRNIFDHFHAEYIPLIINTTLQYGADHCSSPSDAIELCWILMRNVFDHFHAEYIPLIINTTLQYGADHCSPPSDAIKLCWFAADLKKKTDLQMHKLLPIKKSMGDREIWSMHNIKINKWSQLSLDVYKYPLDKFWFLSNMNWFRIENWFRFSGQPRR